MDSGHWQRPWWWTVVIDQGLGDGQWSLAKALMMNSGHWPKPRWWTVVIGQRPRWWTVVIGRGFCDEQWSLAEALVMNSGHWPRPRWWTVVKQEGPPCITEYKVCFDLPSCLSALGWERVTLSLICRMASEDIKTQGSKRVNWISDWFGCTLSTPPLFIYFRENYCKTVKLNSCFIFRHSGIQLFIYRLVV